MAAIDTRFGERNARARIVINDRISIFRIKILPAKHAKERENERTARAAFADEGVRVPSRFAEGLKDLIGVFGDVYFVKNVGDLT